MSPRTTGILFLVALSLGAFIYLYELRGGEQDRVEGARDQRLFPGVDAARIDRIELTTTDGRRAVAVRQDEGWSLVEPLSFAGDEVALDGMASQLAQMEREGSIEQPGPASDYGLEGEAALLRFRADGDEHRLRIGRRTPVGSNTYVQVGSGPEVGFAATWRTNALRKSLTELRDRKVLGFDHASVTGVTVSWPATRLVARKLDDGWWITEPVLERADQETFETLLSDLAFLSAEGFIDDPALPQELGLDAPALQVELRGQGAGGGTFDLEIAFGEPPDGGLVVKGGAGALYRVSPQRLADFPRELIAYRFKQLSRFEVADARSFELLFSGGDGSTERIRGELRSGDWATTPIELDPRRVSALLAELAHVEADAIVADALGDDELAAVGLAPARLVARAWDEEGEVLGEVRLGVIDPEQGWLAQRADVGTVYRLDPGISGRIPESMVALEADFLPAAESGLEDGPEATGELGLGLETDVDEAMADELHGADAAEPPPRI